MKEPNEQVSTLLEHLKLSQAWLAKLMADYGQDDQTGIYQRCNRQYERNEEAIQSATTALQGE